MRYFNKFMIITGTGILLLAGCAAPTRMIGANYLQSRSFAMDKEGSAVALSLLRDTGANTVAFIPFLRQGSTGDMNVVRADNVTDAQLRAGMRDAKTMGFMVVLKPQVLVPDSWAGRISMKGDSEWRIWFENYGKALEHYADIAREERADILVIGTELNQTADLDHWRPLISRVRERFPGKLTYAAHNIEGIIKFRHWDMMDIVSLTLYPSLGKLPDKDAMSEHVKKTVEELGNVSRELDRPLWIAELGIPSRRGAQEKPWLWQKRDIVDFSPDESIQAIVLDIWLNSLKDRWVQGVMLWNWTSDPGAGGPNDINFTIQNKQAERVVACRWTGRCLQP